MNDYVESYKTFVGGQQVKLSGVQKQRLEIARALYEDKDVIVFDGVTSDLDEENHKIIAKYLLEMNKTIITVSHNFKEAHMDLIDNVIW